MGFVGKIAKATENSEIKYKSLKYSDLYLIFHRFSVFFIELVGVHEILPHYFIICAGDGNYLLYLKKYSIRIVMPYISIECGTLTAVQKQNLIEQLTEAAVETTGIPKQFFMVSIKELPDDSIGIGGRSIDRIKKEYGNDEAAG